jgi:hypothetical protein
VFELADAGGQAGGAFLGGEQVCLQGGAADGGPGAGHAGWLGFGGVDLIAARAGVRPPSAGGLAG